MKISAVRPLSVEAVEFSPAPAKDRRPGRKTMSSGTGGSSPTEVVELPLSKAGGGGEVHGGSGGSQAALNGRRRKVFSPSQWATGYWKHISWESSRDVECSPGRHARQQAENAWTVNLVDISRCQIGQNVRCRTIYQAGRRSLLAIGQCQMLWYKITHQVEKCVSMTIRQCHTKVRIMQYRRHRQCLQRTRRQEASLNHLY